MRAIYIFIFTITFLVSCGSDDDVFSLAIAGCGVENPLEQLTWLKAEVERRAENQNAEMKYCYIVQGKLEGNTVFIYEDCNPLVDKAIFILNCEGNSLDADGFATSNIVENKKIIWRTDNFACTTDI